MTPTGVRQVGQVGQVGQVEEESMSTMSTLLSVEKDVDISLSIVTGTDDYSAVAPSTPEPSLGADSVMPLTSIRDIGDVGDEDVEYPSQVGHIGGIGDIGGIGGSIVDQEEVAMEATSSNSKKTDGYGYHSETLDDRSNRDPLSTESPKDVIRSKSLKSPISPISSKSSKSPRYKESFPRSVSFGVRLVDADIAPTKPTNNGTSAIGGSVEGSMEGSMEGFIETKDGWIGDEDTLPPMPLDPTLPTLPPAPTPFELIYIADEATVGTIRSLQEAVSNMGTRLRFLTYLYKHFRMITTGSLTDIQKLRTLQKLQPGEALEGDEKLSMSLEDIMSLRIQCLVRLRFGRIMRAAVMRKRDGAARKIQMKYRSTKTLTLSYTRGLQLKLAIAVQRLWRGYKALEFVRKLQEEYERYQAMKLINRAVLGYRGRKRLSMKREFVKNISDATAVVSLNEMHPG